MKNTLLRKIIVPVMMVFMAVTVFASSLLPVMAEAAAIETIIAAEKTTAEKTVEAGENTKKMSGEEAKSIGKQLKSLRQKKLVEKETIKWAKGQPEARTKEKITEKKEGLNQINASIPGIIASIKDLKSEDSDFDTAACLSSVLDLASGVAACFVPWGTVASIGLDFIQTISSAIMGGESGPDANALMEDRLNQRLDEIADQISEVQDQLTQVSDEINASTEKIISSVSTALENETDKDNLRDFMLSSGQGDFSYKQLRNIIYGKTTNNSNATTAYSGQLHDALYNGGTSEEIQYYYDLLYGSLVAHREQFHQYVMASGIEGKSIVATYYDFVSAHPELLAELGMGMSAEMAAIQFAYDLYQTELEMANLILTCNNYQYTYMEIYDQNTYDYGTGEVLKTEILNEKGQSEIGNELTVGIDELRMQFAKDLVYVLGTTDSYVVEYDGRFYYNQTTEVDGVSYVEVFVGQKVYLNTIPDVLCDRFDLKADAFNYTGEGLLEENGIINEDGIIQIKETNINDTFTLKYHESAVSKYVIDTIRFVDASHAAFSGGEGTVDSPYLISTKEQFLRIADGLDKHYCLVKDIDLGGMEIAPFGYRINNAGAEVYDEFTGSLDGNGYEISNLKISGSKKTGVFGQIGEGAVVKNLTVYAVDVTANISRASESTSTFTGGIIAGINNGDIASCTVSGCDLKVISNTTNEGAERSVFLKYGGIVGVNSGTISAALVKSTTVDVSSTHDFGGLDKPEIVYNNQNNVFVGGICGTCPGTLEYAGVEQDVVLKAYAKSVLNPSTTVNPCIKAIIGGVTTDEGVNIDKITQIYCSSTSFSVDYELDVQSNYGDHYDNAKKYGAPNLIPGLSEEDAAKRTATAEVVRNKFFAVKDYEIEVIDSTACYDVSAVVLNEENLEITVNDQVMTDCVILDTYGFSTYNASFTEETESNITLLFIAQMGENSSIMTGTFPIKIGKNYVKSFDVINYPTQYFKGQEVQTTVSIQRHDANGDTVSMNNTVVTVKNTDTATAEIGTKKLELSYEGATCEVDIEVLCNIHYTNFDYTNTAHFTPDTSVQATCQHGGYDEYICVGCGEKIQINRTGVTDHKVIKAQSKDATCEAPGEIGEVYCEYCYDGFEGYSKNVSIPQKSHNIINIDDPNNHKCTICGKEYAHDFTVTESIVDGDLTYTYICHCGYIHEETDTNIITNEKRLYPTVVVSDGYALKLEDLVTVYVDLENNPGVEGADFGIRYDERLELVQWQEGNFFKGSVTDASAPVSCGYNFVWGNEAIRTAEGGNLLKLVFRLPEGATAQDRYTVSVVYHPDADSVGGFAVNENVCTQQGVSPNEPQQFITKDGVIRIVDRLPGDMTNDGVVDLRDAVYLSNRLVHKDTVPFTTEEIHYGDVNLSFKVDVNDVVKVLQSISGGYGASLLSPDYEIQLNTNGFTDYYMYTDEDGETVYRPATIAAQLYGENHTYAALADIEQEMCKRPGYKFMGWYTRLEGGDRVGVVNDADGTVDYNTQVKYDPNQKIQTLYARWEKNSVTFDTNGATSTPLEKQDYLENGEQWIVLEKPEEKYNVIFRDPNDANNKQEVTVSREFDYWQGSDGNKYYAGEKLAVHKANMGELTLTAQWKAWNDFEFPKLEKLGYNPNSITWCTDSNCNYELGTDVYESIKALPEKILYAHWKEANTYYVEYDLNGGTGTIERTTHKYDVSNALTSIKPTRQYTVTFDWNWDNQKNDVEIQHDFLYWAKKDGTSVEMADKMTAEPNGTITVYAEWNQQYVKLDKLTGRPGYEFAGWYKDPELTSSAGVTGDLYEVTGECTLYAKWAGLDYTIVFDQNTPGEASSTPKNVPAAIKTKNGVEVSLPGGPSLTGWTFEGWYLEPACVNKAGNKDLAPSGEVKLYAKWTADLITIKYDPNGGTVSITSEKRPFDHKYIHNGSLPVPTRTGYVFDGWTKDSQLVTNSTEILTTNQHTLKAKWTPITYKVKIWIADMSKTYTIAYDEERRFNWVDVANEIEVLASEFNFEGWYYSNGMLSYTDFITSSETLTVRNWTAIAGTTFTVAAKISQKSCVTGDTMVTLGDGTQVRVDSLTGEEELLVWNMATGRLDSSPIMFVDSDAESQCEVVCLTFSDGTVVKVIDEHGFWDYDLNKYVYLDKNAADYLGHSFAKQNGDQLKKVALVDVTIEKMTVTAWSPVTEEHLCYFVEGMLSMPGGATGMFNIFEVNSETMAYDHKKIQQDIEKYGLFTYEELAAYAPSLTRDMFEICGGAYLKISLGKGNVTMEQLIFMIERYSKYF